MVERKWKKKKQIEKKKLKLKPTKNILFLGSIRYFLIAYIVKV